MRKFFKSLAVLLALTLIVGVVPAAAADSLTMAKEKTLYLGGSQGAKEDGTNCKITAKKKVANMIKGFDADTMTVVLSSADKSIVKTTKAGRIVAKSIGTTTVTVTVLDAAETQIFKQDLKVKVKKNATDVTVTGIADGDNFKVGQTVEVTLPRAGADTDERELTVDKTDIVEIKASTEKARVYSVKFLKAGDATFTAKAYQSTKYPVPTQKKEIKIKVTNPAPTSVKVVASNAYELTFEEDVEAFGLFKDAKEIPNDACYYMLNDTKVTQSAIKGIKAKGNTVKVTMYDNFASDTDYYVVINGCDPLSFKIAGTGAKDVVDIAILTDKVVFQTAAPITVALYNKDGVDIFESVKASGKLNLSLSTTNLQSFVDGQTLNMYNVGDTTELTATFTYYDENDGYKAYPYSAKKTIVAVEPASMIYTGLVYSVDGRNDGIYDGYSNPKTYIALGDTGFTFKALVKYTLNGVPGSIAVTGDTGVNAPKFNGHTLTAKIPEEAIALLAASHIDGSVYYPIVPNSVGNTNVFIGYYATDGDTSTKFTTVAVAPIQVKESRVPTALSVKPSQSTLNTQTTGMGAGHLDQVEVTAEVKDQYGDAIDLPNASDLLVTQHQQSKDSAELLDKAFSRNSAGTYKLYVNPEDIRYAATNTNNVANIVFSVKVNLWYAKTPEVSCSFTAKLATGQQYDKDNVEFKNSGAGSLETTVTGFTAYKSVKLQASTSNNGYYTGKIANVVLTDTVPSKTNVGTGTSIEFKMVIKKDGVAVVTSGAGFNIPALNDFLTVDQATGYVRLNNFKVAGASKNAVLAQEGISTTVRPLLTKCPTGQYVFAIYKIQKHATDAARTVISSQQVVVNVTDKQEAPTFTQKEEKMPSSGLFTDCFSFTFAGTTDLAANFVGSYNGTPRVTAASNGTGNWFVNSAQVTCLVTIQDQAGWWSTHDVYIPLESTIKKVIKK